jgi:hypothetical protein
MVLLCNNRSGLLCERICFMKSVLLHGFNGVFENTWFIHAIVTLIFLYSVGLCCVDWPTFQHPHLKYWQRIYY